MKTQRLAALDHSVCRRCKQEKPDDQFARGGQGSNGRQTWCRACTAEYRASLDPESERLRKRTNNLAKYGLTPEQYDALSAAQGGLCAVCSRPPDGKHRTLYVDHDHGCCPGLGSCGDCVRGLICHPCNVGLGMFRDDVEALKAAVSYLESSKTLAQASMRRRSTNP